MSGNRVLIPLRLRAAKHELRCRECRVTWLSWWRRLAGDGRGYAPYELVADAAAEAAWPHDPPPATEGTTDGRT